MKVTNRVLIEYSVFHRLDIEIYVFCWKCFKYV